MRNDQTTTYNRYYTRDGEKKKEEEYLDEDDIEEADHPR